MQIGEVLAHGATYRKLTIGATEFNTIGSSYRSSIAHKTINPIQRIVKLNDELTVDFLLGECKDLIDSRYHGWFAKRFYRLDRQSVLDGASLARQEGKWPQRYFNDMIKQVYA